MSCDPGHAWLIQRQGIGQDRNGTTPPKRRGRARQVPQYRGAGRALAVHAPLSGHDGRGADRAGPDRDGVAHAAAGRTSGGRQFRDGDQRVAGRVFRLGAAVCPVARDRDGGALLPRDPAGRTGGGRYPRGAVRPHDRHVAGVLRKDHDRRGAEPPDHGYHADPVGDRIVGVDRACCCSPRPS